MIYARRLMVLLASQLRWEAVEAVYVFSICCDLVSDSFFVLSRKQQCKVGVKETVKAQMQ